MKRIVIIGSGGAGKSTLAVKLGRTLAIPVHHLDTLFWKPNWVETDKEAWVDIQNEICKRENWVIDGNYTATMDIRFEASDTIIFLDFSRLLCLYRALKRILSYYNTNRPDMAEGCNERISLQFLSWIWNYPKTRKPKVLLKLEQLKKSKDVFILKSPKEVNVFLEKCG